MTIAPTDAALFKTLEETTPAEPEKEHSNLYYFGRRRAMLPGPEAFLAYCETGHEVDSHFHKIDQYQILFGSPGAYYQRHLLPKALLQYTDAYSVYGPFGASEAGPMNFYTLRGAPSDLHGSMPKCRDELLYRGERHHHVDLEPHLDATLPPPGESVCETLIAPEADGLAAHVLRLGPGAEVDPPPGELRTGRYTVVLAGEVRDGDRVAGVRSLAWSSDETPPLRLRAGDAGCVAVCLHLPYPATPTVRLGA